MRAIVKMCLFVPGGKLFTKCPEVSIYLFYEGQARACNDEKTELAPLFWSNLFQRRDDTARSIQVLPLLMHAGDGDRCRFTCRSMTGAGRKGLRRGGVDHSTSHRSGRSSTP